MAETGAYCLRCGDNRLHRREEPNHVLWAILTLFSCGLFGIVWIIVSSQTRPWLCSVCGTAFDQRAINEANYQAHPELRPAPAAGRPWAERSWSEKWGFAAIFGGLLCSGAIIILIAWSTGALEPPRPVPGPSPSTASAVSMPSNTPSFQASGNAAHDLLAKMADAEKNTVLAMSVRSAGDPCAAGRRNFFQGFDASRNAFWNVECSSGRAFLVMYYNDGRGSTKILDCAMLKAVSGTRCFVKF